jgi:hypothetical protein
LKRINLKEITGITGKPFLFVERDTNDSVVLNDKGLPNLIHTSKLIDVLEQFILYGFPRDKYTKLDAIRVGNVYRAISVARKEKAAILEVDESEHDWLKEKVSADDIGVRMFTRDVTVILDALDDFERLHQKKE